MLVAGLCLPGCEKAKAPPPRPATQQATAPFEGQSAATGQAPAGPDEEEDTLVSKAMIRDTTVADAQRLDKYKSNPRLVGGTICGVCFVPAEKPVAFPQHTPVWPEGPNAIAGPEKGEAEYFDANPAARVCRVGRWNRDLKRYGISHAAVIVRGVAEGKRPRLNRPSFLANCRTGRLEIPEGGCNYGAENICFGPMYERLQLANTEFYPCRITVTNTANGQTFLEETLKGYSDPKAPGQRFGTSWGMAAPEVIQSPPLREAGRYAVTCARHPWHRAHLFVVDNPYVGVSNSEGMFTIEDVPEGKYAIDIWHEQFEPLKASFTVEVKANKTTELPVEFKPPSVLTSPPPAPDQVVKQVAFLGAFGYTRDKLPPDAELDFKAGYEGKDAQRIGWKLSPADNNGWVKLAGAAGRPNTRATTSYVCAYLDSPRVQAAVLGLGASEFLRLWVNGAPIFSQRGNMGAVNAVIVQVRLKQGRNVILARVDCGGDCSDGAVALTYHADNVTVSAPDVPR